MFRFNLEEHSFHKTYFVCFVLTFLSGTVNVGGFLACGRFVSHVTGFATILGLDIAVNNWMAALSAVTMPVYFMIGSVISAYLVDKKINQRHVRNYPVILLLISLCLLVVVLGGLLNFYGPFGGDYDMKQDYLLVALLCGASGLQNAALTSFSGAVVRTTHLTGITTDLGIGIARIFSRKLDEKDGLLEKRANQLRTITLSAFISGSIVGAFLFIRFQYLGFFLPLSIAIYATVESFLAQRKSSAHA